MYEYEYVEQMKTDSILILTINSAMISICSNNIPHISFSIIRPNVCETKFLLRNSNLE